MSLFSFYNLLAVLGELGHTQLLGPCVRCFRCRQSVVLAARTCSRVSSLFGVLLRACACACVRARVCFLRFCCRFLLCARCACACCVCCVRAVYNILPPRQRRFMVWPSSAFGRLGRTAACSPKAGESDLRAGFYTKFCVGHDGTIPPAPPTTSTTLSQT